MADVFVLILFHPHTFLLLFLENRINKKGSQKDAEQKKNGNYFFYDDGGDDDDDDFDDI